MNICRRLRLSNAIILVLFVLHCACVKSKLPLPVIGGTPELVISAGYPLETHTVETEDGFLLTYFRIPYGKKSPPVPGKPPVILQHGILMSSSAWFFQDEDKTLPFMLADEGYDVWVGNSRGTSYSRAHRYLNTSQPEYWKFSFEEMGTKDTSAAIDYILNLTFEEKLFYIGHSQGTTQFFTMLALRPEYNSKIRLMSAFAPAAFLDHLGGALLTVFSILFPIIRFIGYDTPTQLGFGQQLPQTILNFISQYFPHICSKELVARKLCQNILFVIAGYDEPQTNLTKLPLIKSQFADSTALNSLIHYSQLRNSARFARFDHGILENLRCYGDTTPPDYVISNIRAPVALYYAENDFISNTQDVVRFSHLLPNLVNNYSVPFPLFNHLDFHIGINASELVYEETIWLMKQY